MIESRNDQSIGFPSPVFELEASVPTAARRSALSRLFQRIGDISTIPAAALRLAQLPADEDTQAKQLREILESDPALAARVLRRVNSSFYGLRCRVADLRTAINLLGLVEVKNLTFTVLVAKLYQVPGRYRQYSRVALWRHSLGVGVAARRLSYLVPDCAADEAYLAGLLHDLGFILLDQHLRKQFCRVIEGISVERPTSAVEREILSFDHAQLGAFVAEQWRFPTQIRDAIGYHHEPMRYRGPQRGLIHVVSLADYLSARYLVPSLGVMNTPCPGEQLFADLGLNPEGLDSLVDELAIHWKEAESLAQL
jgi:HD-like signal output (HDOD) protein